MLKAFKPNLKHWSSPSCQTLSIKWSQLGKTQLPFTFVYVCEDSRSSYVRLFATPWTVAHQTPLSTGFYRQEYWSALPCPPPWDLPDSSNPHLLHLLHCRQILSPLSHLGSPPLTFKFPLKVRASISAISTFPLSKFYPAWAWFSKMQISGPSGPRVESGHRLCCEKYVSLLWRMDLMLVPSGRGVKGRRLKYHTG